MPFKFFDDLTFADVAFEATGKTIEEMFESAANATTASMIEGLKTVKKKESIEISLEAPSEERLLFDFLQEIIFYKDAKQLLFSGYSIKISFIKRRELSTYSLKATLKGEKMDPMRHNMIVDVKAVSWHQFKVAQSSDGIWIAFVILDV